MDFRVREMRKEDLPAAVALWDASEGVTVTTADTPENLAIFLRRNRGLSFVAEADGRITGAVLGSHDGRRGYLHHLAVRADGRRHGVGRRLAAQALAGIRAAGIEKVHIFLERDNAGAREFWARVGWTYRTDLRMMSRVLADRS